jgi:cell division protein FtsQ
VSPVDTAPDRTEGDPRLAGRPPRRGPGSQWEARARYRRRRLLALGLLLALIAAAALGGGRVALLHAARFRVSQIDVAGAAQVDPAWIRAVSGVQVGEPLLEVRTEDVRGRVAAIPLLASVEVTRDWPSTVHITVTERTPVAVAASAAGPQLVDSTGFAYEAAPKPAPALPRLAADRVAPGDPNTEAGLAVLAALNPGVREKLQVVEVAAPSQITLRLAGNKQVRWGAVDDSPRKGAVLAALLTQPGTIFDVSAPDLPTIRR